LLQQYLYLSTLAPEGRLKANDGLAIKDRRPFTPIRRSDRASRVNGKKVAAAAGEEEEEEQH
jgi:hypothetical protein